MFALILITILALATLFAWAMLSREIKHTGPDGLIDDGFVAWPVILSVALVIVVAIFSHVFVPTNHAGIINSFGVNQADRYYSQGFNLKWPWERVRNISLAFENLEFFEGSASEQDAIPLYTRDGYTIYVPMAITWAADPRSVAVVKSRLPADGIYTTAQVAIIRTAARNVGRNFSYRDGTVFDRQALGKALAEEIRRETAVYYFAQGFERPGEIIRYGHLTLRGVTPPQEIIQAQIDAEAAAIRTQVPAGRSVSDYTAVQDAQTGRAAVDRGNPVTIVMGDAPAVAVAGARQ